MRELLESKTISISNRFGDGPIWRMRVIRPASEILGFNADFLLRHSFQRAIYAVPLAASYKEYLQGKERKLEYYDYPLSSLVEYWRKRWLDNRRNSSVVKQAVMDFKKSEFIIS